MFVAEVDDAGLDGVDEVAEEADRVLDDLADRAGRPGEDAEQHVLELEDRLDRAADGVLGLVPQALVLLLHRLDLLVDGLACLDVLRGEVVGEGVLLAVDVALELVELRAELLGRVRRATFCRSLGCSATYSLIFARPSAIWSFARVSSAPMKSATWR